MLAANFLHIPFDRVIRSGIAGCLASIVEFNFDVFRTAGKIDQNMIVSHHSQFTLEFVSAEEIEEEPPDNFEDGKHRLDR
jgi:hypothetical protein